MLTAIADAIKKIGDPAIKILINSWREYFNEYHKKGIWTDTDKKILKAMERTLIKIGKPAVKFLIGTIESYDYWSGKAWGAGDHVAVIDVLGEIGDPGAINLLAELICIKDQWAQGHNNVAACMALKKIGEPAVNSLIKIMRDESMLNWMKFKTIEILENIGTPKALKAIEEFYNEDNSK